MAKKKIKGLWTDFKKFISRGSVVDMAIGVVIGSAFSAIITSVTGILLSLCTWMIPGGINGLISVLPASSLPDALAGVGQTFTSSSLDSMVEIYASAKSGGEAFDEALRLTYQADLLSNYKLYGGTYVYNGAAVINWGAVINAVISFLIIAITLFIILKIYSSLKASRAKLNAKLQEEYYKKHPEERPVVEAPKAPEPTEKDYLKQIAYSLKGRGRTGRRHF